MSNEITTREDEFNGYPVLVITFGEYQGKPKEFSLGKMKCRALLQVLNDVYKFAEMHRPKWPPENDETPF